MIITDLLERNAKEFADDVALVEINPPLEEKQRLTWKEYALIEGSNKDAFRSEITWKEFNKKANRFANLLLSRGIKKGDKVAILLMNCLEWLPIYFGILKTGALAVPLNYRYTADEIKYCVELAEADVLVFGPEFTGRVETICNRLKNVQYTFYVVTIARHLPRAMTGWLHIVQREPLILSSPRMTRRQSIFHRVQRDSRKQLSMLTEVLFIRRGLNKITTDRQRMMFSFVFRRFITQVQKCTGSEVLSRAAGRYCSKALSPSG